jgi:hypothetical protein
MLHMKRTLIAGLATAALVSGGLGLAGLGPAGTAHADDPVGGPFQWCPGDSMDYSTTAYLSGADNGPGRGYSWNMNICHTWYRLKNIEAGNVPYNGDPHSDVWDGNNPPAGLVLPPLPACPPSILPCL